MRGEEGGGGNGRQFQAAAPVPPRISSPRGATSVIPAAVNTFCYLERGDFPPDHHLAIPHQEVVRPARESWDTDESARAEGAQLPSSDKSDFVLTSPSPSSSPPSSSSSRTRQCWMAGH